MYPIPTGEHLVENRTCKQCSAVYPITDRDMAFYERVSPIFGGKKYLIPPPTLCPECREQRRLSFFNQTNIYNNTCDLCREDIVSRFNTKSRIKNYCNTCWSSESWNQLEFSVAFDMSKPASVQLRHLIENTPFQSLIGSASNIVNNSTYTNHTSEIHDSYLIFEANTVDKSLYSFSIKKSQNIVDSTFVGNSDSCYECIDCYNMFESFYCQNSYESKFSYFLDNCTDCSYCIGCKNLQNKSYYFLNQPITPEKYAEISRLLSGRTYKENLRNEIQISLMGEIVAHLHIVGSEDCMGNNIIHSKGCYNSYDILECQDMKYCTSMNYSSDVFDVSAFGEESHNMYESVSVGRYSRDILFSDTIGKGENLIYCIDVKKSKYCFLCVNLEGKQYCILNKQYTKEEYESLVPIIIEKMIADGEWGEFFPASMSPFGYNETVAQEYFPLEQKKALESGFNWSNYEAPFPNVDKTIPASKLPDTIDGIPDDIVNWAIICEVSGKLFRIIKQELEFYRKHHLPIPRRHPDVRHANRMKMRNPRKLYECVCDKCSKDIISTYAPERSERVYCEECYNKSIY